jgi:hypothetical protein
MKLRARWGAGYFDVPLVIVMDDPVLEIEFSDSDGYTEEDRQGIAALKPGEVWWENSPHPSHSIGRLA